ncbi:MAG: hypothetical protein AAF940_09755 [Pseudomonadota bacterium]
MRQLFAFMVPAGSSPATLLSVIGTVAVPSAMAFFGFALVFSKGSVVSIYAKARRWIDGAFALVFGVFASRVLTSRIVD